MTSVLTFDLPSFNRSVISSFIKSDHASWCRGGGVLIILRSVRAASWTLGPRHLGVLLWNWVSKDSPLPTRTSLRFPMTLSFSNRTPWRFWTSVTMCWTSILDYTFLNIIGVVLCTYVNLLLKYLLFFTILKIFVCFMSSRRLNHKRNVWIKIQSLQVFALNQTVNGTRLFWGVWKTSAHSSWTVTTIIPTSNSPICPALPPYGLTRTKSAIFPLLWKRSAPNFLISGEFFYRKPSMNSNLVVYLFGFPCRILSMMNNEAAPSYFNGGSLTQYIDYR